MGPNSMLKKLKTRNKNFLLVNEGVTCKGSIIRKYAVGEEYCVECGLAAEKNSGERCTSATAVVSLPLYKER